MIIVGDKDIEANKITVESRDRGQIGQIDVATLVNELVQEVNLNK
jgi:threonyl-tRNA synthetase